MSKKEEILKIASQNFAKYGYRGVVLENIAKKANITKAAIYYHFKNKMELYEQVLKRRIGELLNNLEKSTLSDPKKNLENYISIITQTFTKYPCFAAILSHEFVDGGINLNENLIKELSKIFKKLFIILNQGVKNDIFEIDNPFTIQLMIISSLLCNQATKELRKKISKYIEIPVNPDIKNISSSLTDKILKAISKENK